MAIDFRKTSVQGEINFSTFGCDVYKGDFETPDRLNPDAFFVREFYGSGKLEFPDGFEAEIWGFRDPLSSNPVDSGKPFPSPLIRVRQGQIAHVKLTASKNTHTIHHHGIEPTTFNDGVGHMSFEVGDEYTYQWQANLAGTYFYHCHKNTVLHFEKGMYGLLIVDPPSGPGTLWAGGPAYDVERALVFDDLDPRWHDDNGPLEEHDAGLCGEDVGLNRFEPQYFICNGVPSQRTPNDPRTIVRARVGQRVLLRMLNASYSILRYTIPLDATLMMIDGRGLGRTGSPWSRPVPIPRNRATEFTTAQRHDIILQPTAPGTYRIRTQFLNWVTRDIQHGGRGVVDVNIVVTP
jgi:FtsP/CotA-like multicopper oxidase with cupredoxin domain